MATLHHFKTLLHDEDTEARVLTFPKGHCWSSATGFLKSPDGKGLFVKDRDDDEALLQETIYLAGKEFCKPFATVDRVTPVCYSIDRPCLEEFDVGNPGHRLWKLKEEQWKKDDDRVTALRQRKKGAANEANNSSGDVQIADERKPPPSAFDCWQLEEAAIYSLESADELDERDASETSVDQSLRKKLRVAAGRSGTKCLDFGKVLMMTKYAQDKIRTDPEWEECKDYLLKYQEEALSASETHWLLTEKLSGVQFEVAVLFATAIALPDVNIENLALEECQDGDNYGVRLLHFDTGVAPVRAGVSLDKLNPIYGVGSPEDFTVTGATWCNGYYLPCFLALPAINKPLSLEALNGLQKIDTSALERILSEYLSDPEVFAKDLGAMGGIVKQRVEMMKAYATAHPSRSLRDLMFHAVTAWERDFPAWLEQCETPELMVGTLEWAESR